MVLGPVSIVETVLLVITGTRVKQVTVEPALNVNLPPSRPRQALGLALHARAVPLDLVAPMRPIAALSVCQDSSSMRQRATVIHVPLERFSRTMHPKMLFALHAQTKQCGRHRRAQI